MKSEFRDWSDIRAFLAVMREGSTLAASRQLGVAQPTVARRIETLEHATGLTLFDRDTRGFHPTGAARTLLPLAEAVETAANAFAAKSRDLSQPRAIRITAYSGNFSQKAATIFAEFTADHPDVQFEFLPSLRTLDLIAGEADVALRLPGEPPDPSLIRRKISTARWTLYGSKPYADKHGLPASLDDLHGHRFVTFQRPDVSDRLHRWLLGHVNPDQIVMSCHEVELQHAAIVAGRGLGIINLRMAADIPALIRCFDPPEDWAAEHLLLVSPQAYRRPEVKAFVKFFAPRYAAIFR